MKEVGQVRPGLNCTVRWLGGLPGPNSAVCEAAPAEEMARYYSRTL